jgi:hypothetical protein
MSALAVVARTALGWQGRAKCRDVDTTMFYPEKENGGYTDSAKRVCEPCPVRDECLEYALDNREPFGVWGGLSTRERDTLEGWKYGDPLPRIRYTVGRVVADATREQAEQSFAYAVEHGTQQAAWRYGVAQTTLRKIWDKFELGLPRPRGRDRNSPDVHSREWAERTYQQAQQTSVVQVARTHHVGRRTLRSLWAKHGLGQPTKEGVA